LKSELRQPLKEWLRNKTCKLNPVFYFNASHTPSTGKQLTTDEKSTQGQLRHLRKLINIYQML